MPPKRTLIPRVSSTDIADLHLLRAAVVAVEALAAQPGLDGADLLADATGEQRERQQQEDGSDNQRRDLGAEVGRAGERVERVLQEGEPFEQVPEQGEERGADHDA